MDMRDIAKIAGVSNATVSRVINGLNVVRPATAERVRRVIDELKFIPTGSATPLKCGRSGTYGLIIPDITNPFYSEFIQSFEGILAASNHNMLMSTAGSYPPEVQKTIVRMLVRQVEGIVLLASEIDTEPIEAMVNNRVPLVTMDRRLVGNGLSDVSIDVQFLREGNYRINGGEKAMAELLDLNNRPTAIITANDLTAIGALRVIRKHGLSVPGDFSIVGFDDIELSDIVFPPLTTLNLPRQELARKFVDALETFVPDPRRVGKQYKVGTTLVVRSSTGPVKKRL
jgi:LacI family transcriptional regulator